MEFGDNEWFEEVEQKGVFPSDYAFYTHTDRRISAVCLNSNVKNIATIKYRTLNSWSDSALIEVANCQTAKDYYEITKKLKERWS